MGFYFHGNGRGKLPTPNLLYRCTETRVFCRRGGSNWTRTEFRYCMEIIKSFPREIRESNPDCSCPRAHCAATAQIKWLFAYLGVFTLAAVISCVETGGNIILRAIFKFCKDNMCKKYMNLYLQIN